MGSVIIAVVITLLVTAVVVYFVTTAYYKKVTEAKIGNADEKAREIIDEAVKTAELVKIPGHPLHTFTLENEALAKTIKKCREALKSGHVEYKLIEEVRQLAIHYAKKGDLLYPHLKVKYEISGPSDVMWTVDDEIRDEFAALAYILGW